MVARSLALIFNSETAQWKKNVVLLHCFFWNIFTRELYVPPGKKGLKISWRNKENSCKTKFQFHQTLFVKFLTLTLITGNCPVKEVGNSDGKSLVKLALVFIWHTNFAKEQTQLIFYWKPSFFWIVCSIHSFIHWMFSVVAAKASFSSL